MDHIAHDRAFLFPTSDLLEPRRTEGGRDAHLFPQTTLQCSKRNRITRKVAQLL